MAAQPSSAPWVDEPYDLLPVPEAAPDHKSHTAYIGAVEMTHAHNCLIRGLNAVVQQAPHVPDVTSPRYKKRDVADLLFYVVAWVKTLEHHHDVEETILFPEIEAFAGTPGRMAVATEQHKLFTPGLERLLAYAENTQPSDFRWEGTGGLRSVIDSFSEPLMQHMADEIDVLLALRDLDSDGLFKIMQKAQAAAKANGGLALFYDMFPLTLGASDKTYGGGNTFPPIPSVMPYVIKYWFARSHSGAWRFNPCDFFGKPRPLAFGPGSTL